MSELDQTQAGEITLSTRMLVPTVQRIGGRDIETTFLGNNSFGQPSWVLWNHEEPYLIGLLRQGEVGYTFEQRTSAGVLVHEEISFKKVQKALASGGQAE